MDTGDLDALKAYREAQRQYEDATRAVRRIREDPTALVADLGRAEAELRACSVRLREANRRLRDARRSTSNAPVHARRCACGVLLGAMSAAALQQAWSSHARDCAQARS